MIKPTIINKYKEQQHILHTTIFGSNKNFESTYPNLINQIHVA